MNRKRSARRAGACWWWRAGAALGVAVRIEQQRLVVNLLGHHFSQKALFRTFEMQLFPQRPKGRDDHGGEARAPGMVHHGVMFPAECDQALGAWPVMDDDLQGVQFAADLALAVVPPQDRFAQAVEVLLVQALPAQAALAHTVADDFERATAAQQRGLFGTFAFQATSA